MLKKRALLGFLFEELSKLDIFQAVLGMDILCQAKSGMGKTAVFVLATLQQLEPVDGQVIGVRGGGKVFKISLILHFNVVTEKDVNVIFIPGVY